ncbi:hypothetical protein H6G11_15655 [Cyanobacterium aponinum FACHB-4101]|uniref:hypothetical protein n=1 Tax=Cyanobacterium aponinum TaxID=379064 RepID=UPI001681330E|nr:hypothetical protein [Cyanobacterium aponinum]MBD2395680.1 hypothetical protein [Cyanobacterium aponinum FACHB-4101]
MNEFEKEEYFYFEGLPKININENWYAYWIPPIDMGWEYLVAIGDLDLNRLKLYEQILEMRFSNVIKSEFCTQLHLFSIPRDFAPNVIGFVAKSFHKGSSYLFFPERNKHIIDNLQKVMGVSENDPLNHKFKIIVPKRLIKDAWFYEDD